MKILEQELFIWDIAFHFGLDPDDVAKWPLSKIRKALIYLKKRLPKQQDLGRLQTPKMSAASIVFR